MNTTINNVSVNSIAVVRGDADKKVQVALHDLENYGHLIFADTARMIEPTFADDILVSVMNSPLRTCCGSAAIVALEDDGARAIARVKAIHAPAHIIIVSPRHQIYDELIEKMGRFPYWKNEDEEYEDNDKDVLEGDKEDNDEDVMIEK